jgi:hypothetical protein
VGIERNGGAIDLLCRRDANDPLEDEDEFDHIQTI